MDERFAAESAARAASGAPPRDEIAARLRRKLSVPGARYLAALRTAQAATEGAALDVEAKRMDWVWAAHEALVAERMGPKELAAVLSAGTTARACFELPVGERLEWLVAQAPADAGAELDCLLATLADPASPLLWGEALERPPEGPR
jgi:hypothetical protein